MLLCLCIGGELILWIGTRGNSVWWISVARDNLVKGTQIFFFELNILRFFLTSFFARDFNSRVIKKCLCYVCKHFHRKEIQARFALKHLSRVMRKQTFCICKNKDADQLRGNREADRRLSFRYIDSTIPVLSKSEISSL